MHIDTDSPYQGGKNFSIQMQLNPLLSVFVNWFPSLSFILACQLMDEYFLFSPCLTCPVLLTRINSSSWISRDLLGILQEWLEYSTLQRSGGLLSLVSEILVSPFGTAINRKSGQIEDWFLSSFHLGGFIFYLVVFLFVCFLCFETGSC